MDDLALVLVIGSHKQENEHVLITRFECNNLVGYWAYIRGTYIWGGGGLYSGWLYLGGGYIWNEVSVST